MNELKSNVWAGLAMIGLLIFSILLGAVYVYTIYYFAVNDGFLVAGISSALPCISSIYLFFVLLFKEGLFNEFALLIYGTIISFLVSIVFVCLSEK